MDYGPWSPPPTIQPFSYNRFQLKAVFLFGPRDSGIVALDRVLNLQTLEILRI
jgi:hypothetical protein